MSTTNSWNNQIAAANSVITLNSGTNAVNVSTDATAATTNVATGAGDKTLTLGSTNTTSTTNIQSGSGGINIPQFIEGALITSSVGNVTSVTGTAGFVLTANAAGTAPSFQVAPGGGGGRVLIQSQTATNVATIDFTTGITGYAYYELECLNVLPITDNVDFQMQFSIDAGMTWTGGTSYIYFGLNPDSSANTFSGYKDVGTSQFAITPGNSNSANYAFNGIIELYGFVNLSKQITWSFAATTAALNTQQNLGAGRFTVTASDVNGIRVKFASGNISTGLFRLFGIV